MEGVATSQASHPLLFLVKAAVKIRPWPVFAACAVLHMRKYLQHSRGRNATFCLKKKKNHQYIFESKKQQSVWRGQIQVLSQQREVRRRNLRCRDSIKLFHNKARETVRAQLVTRLARLGIKRSLHWVSRSGYLHWQQPIQTRWATPLWIRARCVSSTWTGRWRQPDRLCLSFFFVLFCYVCVRDTTTMSS